MNPNVLVIDDSPDIHKLLDVRLRSEGLTLHHAYDPATGLGMARTGSPDLILLDVDMPGATGISVCRALKSDLATSSIPVIFLTAVDGVHDRVAGFDAGAVDYIVKPFEPSELRARVRASLRTKRYQDLLSARAQVDALSGLRNRAYFDSRLHDEIAAVRRFGRKLSLVMLDLDHFKRVNDTWGHPAGDRVLQWVGDALTASLRITDAPCRYGGEEFAVLLTETDHDTGLETAERLRAAICSRPVDVGSAEVRVTASLGLVSTESFSTGHALTPESFLAAADAALYEAKGTGRDRVCVGSVPGAAV